MVLFIDSCARENSRTRRLAKYLLSKMNDSVETVRLSEINLPAVDEYELVMRYATKKIHDFSEKHYDLAKQLARADRIVIAAPYWDLSFPALLKRYFEFVNVTGIVFDYSSVGIPVTHCNADKLYYVTTSGGPVVNDAFGFGYIQQISRTFFGINEFEYIKAENLDVIGNNVEEILKDAESRIDDIKF